MLISHDRYFLDVTVNKIVEIWNKHIHFYPGNYDKYLAQKTQRREQIEAAYRNQRERIEQLEIFISRFRYQATTVSYTHLDVYKRQVFESLVFEPHIGQPARCSVQQNGASCLQGAHCAP